MVKFVEEHKTAGFEIIPEGETILKVAELKPIMQAGKVKELKATFEDAKGRKLFNRYTMNKNANNYTPSMKALYSLLKTGCDLKEDADGVIDESQAVGCYIVAEVKHTVSEKDGKTRTYANLGWINGHADAFDGGVTEKSEPQIEAIDDEDDPYA